MTPKIGKKFGLWEVVGDPIRDDSRSHRIPCRCACGREEKVIKNNLLRKQGGSQGCRDCYKRRPKSFRVVPRWFWAHIVCNAKKRRIEMGVTREQAEELFKQQAGQCPLSGRPIGFAVSSLNRGTSTASLDRKDSQKGYTLGNVQWVHKVVNMMKNTLGEEEFVAWCTAIASTSTNRRLVGGTRLLYEVPDWDATAAV